MAFVHFNSKFSTPVGFQELSNFYGGVEFEYMAARFPQREVRQLFDMLETCDNETFWNWCQILNPKKNPTQRQKDYWFTEGGFEHGQPIRGIVAQMLGTMVKPTAAMKKRRKNVAARLSVADIEINDELSDEQKKQWMKACLHHKFFFEDRYKHLLLSTEDAVLHEVPIRGNGRKNNWTFKVIEETGEPCGQDWLGQLLMEVRQDLIDAGFGNAPESAATYKQFVKN